jgi:hypothetical protein
VREFLTDILMNGPVLQTMIMDRGAERSFSPDQLRRAKKALDIEAFKQKSEDGPWYWALLGDVPPDAKKRGRLSRLTDMRGTWTQPDVLV